MDRSEFAGRASGAFEDDYRGFDVREDDTARGPLILALAIGVLLIFGGVVWNTYRQGVRPDGEGLPSVLADPAPFKRVPEDPGGKQVAHTDMRFFDEIDRSIRPVTLTPPAAPAEEALAGGGAAPAPVPSETAMATTDLAPSAEPEGEGDQDRPALAPPEPLPPLGPQARFAFTESGPFMVQLAALRTEEAAEITWRRLAAAAPEVYHGAEKRIERADLGARGVFYRLRAGAFADRSEASAFCEAVKAAGSNCIVVSD